MGLILDGVHCLSRRSIEAALHRKAQAAEAAKVLGERAPRGDQRPSCQDGEFHQTGNAIMLKLRRERDWVPGNVAGYTIAASRANTSTTPSTLEWTGQAG